jgi:cytochrome c553
VRLSLATLLLAAAACTPVRDDAGGAFTASGELIALSGGDGGPANACFTCHGLTGAGDGVSVPRLAGLDAGYLQKQLTDYAGGLRADPAMGPIAKWLDDRDQRAVSVWYASLPAPPSAGPAPAAPQIYLACDPARGLAACANCHGAGGEGVGPGYPALSGQPAAYTVEQLRRWQADERRNDPRGVMADAAAGLTAEELRAIAAWLERAPTAPPPASDAASASAAGAVAARPEASRGGRRPGQ